MTSVKSKVSGLPSALSASGARPSGPSFADRLLLAQGCRVERRDRSSAICGTPDVLPIHSAALHVGLGRSLLG
jgi:hypothetical protein